MTRTGNRRRGLAPLLVVGLVALLVVGFMATSAVLTLREFFGGSRSSAGRDLTPPVPAAPVASLGGDPGSEARGAACRKRLRELEARLVSEVSAGRLAEAEATRRALAEARAGSCGPGSGGGQPG